MAISEKQSNADIFNSTANLTTNTGFPSTISIASKDIELSDKAYNPFEHRQVAHPNSTLGSIVHLLKSCLGTGVLAMPAAFKNAGMITGVIGTLIAGFICTHTIYVLVKISQKLCVEVKKPSMSFAETCGVAFATGPKNLQSWGDFVKSFVDCSLAITYTSVLCVYVVFIGTSLKEVMDVYIPEYNISIQVYCSLTLVPLVIICQIRNLKYLVPISALANGLIVVVFGITIYYVFTDIPPISEREMVANVAQWPLFFSTVVFAMEGIGIVMPIENEMAHPQQFLGCFGVFNTAMIIIISLFGVFGFFGYLKFGDEVKGSITLNLPQDHITAQSAKLLMAFVIFLTYTLQFYVPMEIFQRFLRKRQSNNYKNVTQIGFRIFLVTFSVAVAAAVPNLELVISFAGAIFFSTLGLFLPATIEIIYNWNRGLGRFYWILMKDIIIAILAFIALISGSYVSVKRMIEHFSHNSHHNETLT